MDFLPLEFIDCVVNTVGSRTFLDLRYFSPYWNTYAEKRCADCRTYQSNPEHKAMEINWCSIHEWRYSLLNSDSRSEIDIESWVEGKGFLDNITVSSSGCVCDVQKPLTYDVIHRLGRIVSQNRRQLRLFQVCSGDYDDISIGDYGHFDIIEKIGSVIPAVEDVLIQTDVDRIQTIISKATVSITIDPGLSTDEQLIPEAKKTAILGQIKTGLIGVIINRIRSESFFSEIVQAVPDKHNGGYMGYPRRFKHIVEREKFGESWKLLEFEDMTIYNRHNGS